MNLKVRNVSFAYSSISVLNNVCFELASREILSIIGPNGSGKSTLIKCINNIHKPQQGNILLNNEDIFKMNQIEVAKNIGYVPQISKSTFPTTVFDMILLGRRPHISWRSSEADIDKVIDTLELLGIEDFALKEFGELSGGQQQKVLFARALVQEPQMLLLDEPTSNLDLRQQLEMMTVISKLVKGKGISAIMAIHDLNLASRFSDKIVMLKEGKIFAAGEPEMVFNSNNIKAVYEIETIIKKDSGRPYIIPLSPIH